MTFKPRTNSQRGALGNHTDWQIEDRDGELVLIRCTCHKDLASDLRWVHEKQIVTNV